MSNKYRREHDFRLYRTRPYTDETDRMTARIIRAYEKRYKIRYDPSNSTELQ